MKRFFTIVGKIDRRIIFLLIGLSVLIPLIKPNWLELPIKIDNNTQIVYDSISDLQEGDKVLLSFEYGASTKPEVHPMAVALLKHLFAKGIKVYIVSLWPEGPIMAKLAIDEIIASDLFNLEDGKDYIMFDYKVGGSIVIKQIADDFRGIYKQDYNRIPIEQLQIMEGVYSVEDFNFVFDFFKDTTTTIQLSGQFHLRIPPYIRIPPLINDQNFSRGGFLVKGRLGLRFFARRGRKILGFWPFK